MSLEISIVILYYNKEYELKMVLKSLSLQMYDRNKFEIVIVDDGSEKRIDDLIRRYESVLTIKYLYREHTGNRGSNRNLGVANASAPRIIFIDSDIIPDRDFVACFEESTRHDRKAISLGYRNSLWDFDKNYLDDEIIEKSSDIIADFPMQYDSRMILDIYRQKSGRSLDGLWQLCYTCCLCLWKSEFESIGGFDEVYSKNWGAEDIELGYRLFKNHCTFVINYKVRCYHVFHPEDMVKRIESLKNNYNIFVRKYPDWNVELFVREYETWFVELVDMQEKIKNKEYGISTLNHASSIIDELPENVLVCGIEDETLLNSPKIREAFIPLNELSSKKIKNLIGINTGYPDRAFAAALVSENYRTMSYGLFVKLLTEIERIAERVYVVNESTCGLVDLKEKNVKSTSIASSRHLLMILSDDFVFSYNRHFFLNLALAAREIGVTTGLQLNYDPFKKVDINSGYMRFSDEEKIKKIRPIINHELNILGGEIPCIMDAPVAKYSTRSYGQRITWQELIYGNHERKIKAETLPTTDKIFLRREWEFGLYQNAIEKYYLPIGIDTDKIRRIKRLPRRSNGKFVFLCCLPFTDNLSNLEIVVAAFSGLFSDRSDVELRIVCTGNCLSYNPYDIFPESVNKLLEDSFSCQKLFYDMRLQSMQQYFRENNNIKLIKDIFDEERYSEELCDADVYIDLDSTLKLNPLVLESVAFGKKPVILDALTYAGYCDEVCLKIECHTESAVFKEPVIEDARLGERDFARYCHINRPNAGSVEKTMLEIYQHPDKVAIEPVQATAFCNEFDWRAIAEKMTGILYGKRGNAI